MRANEFISETNDAASNREMAATYVLPGLKSQDPCMQYRFGLALAAARAHASGDATYDTESRFGEDMVVVSRSDEEAETIKMALALFGRDNTSKQISSDKSEESSDVAVTSPVPQNSGRKTHRKS